MQEAAGGAGGAACRLPQRLMGLTQAGPPVSHGPGSRPCGIHQLAKALIATDKAYQTNGVLSGLDSHGGNKMNILL